MNNIFRKTFLYIFIATLTVTGFFALPQEANAQKYRVGPDGNVICPPDETPLVSDGFIVACSGDPSIGSVASGWLLDQAEELAAYLANLILNLTSFLVGLTGSMLNGVVQFTILDTAQNYNSIGTIAEAWRTIRDLANIVFIFLLLYASINTIIKDSGFTMPDQGGDYKKIIVNVVVVGILLNFSMFFTRIVIDASNILAVTFYDATTPGSLTATNANTADNYLKTNYGIANEILQILNLGEIWNKETGILKNSDVIVIGVMGSIFQIIATFAFFSMAMMLITRYVALMLVIVLSPIAFVSFILPAGKKIYEMWVNTLSGQAFFAPIFFFYVWLSLRMLDGIMRAVKGDFGTELASVSESQNYQNPLGENFFALTLNFIIAIILIYVSITQAKSWSEKSADVVKKYSSMARGAVIGGGSKFLRYPAGWLGEKLTKKSGGAAEEGNRGARALNWVGNRLATSSFDPRNAPFLGDTINADNTLQRSGGYSASNDAKIKARNDELDKLRNKYVKNKDWNKLAKIFANRNEGEQQYLYNSLSARDRVAMVEEIKKINDPNLNRKLEKFKNALTLEEQEKMDEVEKKVNERKKQEEKIELIQALVNGERPINPATGAVYTYDDLMVASVFPVNYASKLKESALLNAEVITRLKPKHLDDIRKNNIDISDATIAGIKRIIDGLPQSVPNDKLKANINKYSDYWS